MNPYRIILKTTGLFASLRIVTILVTIVTSKFVAILLGPSGIGFYGVLNSVLSLISSISDLGISKSSIRNISEAKGYNNSERIREIVLLIGKLIFITGFVGGVITVALSYYISGWSFGNFSNWPSFVFVGIAVFFTVLKNGQFAILQGLREFKLISKSTIIGSLFSLLIFIPLVYFFKYNGLAIAILFASIASFLVSRYFLGKLGYSSIIGKRIELSNESVTGIIKLGLSMMWVSFLVSLSGYLIKSFININGSLEDVGYFQAGFQIVSGYFGLIFTSMTTDYFPRISAINRDDDKLEREVNQQAVINLLLICPLVVLFPFVTPYFISLLYTVNFYVTIDYVNFALCGIIFQAGSQTMGMILLAKNNAKVFTISVFFFQAIFLISNIVGYTYYGIAGIGLAFSLNMFFHLVGVQILNRKLYGITYGRNFIFTLFIVIILAIGSLFGRSIENSIIKYFFATILFLGSIFFTSQRLIVLLGLDSVRDFIKSKIR